MTISPESIEELLNSNNFGDRVKGLNHLRQIEPKIAFELIQPLVQDDNPRIRYAAVSQLANLGKENLDLSLEILRDRLYNDKECDVVGAAADSLAALKIPEAFTDLQQVYQQTNDWLIQVSIVAALGELGDPRGFELLEQALSSDNDLIVTVAISALGELGDERAIALLLPLATNQDWQIRHRVAQALGRLDGEMVKPVLTQLAQDEMPQVADEAKTHLGN